jgi:DNA polymerase epsilon subunit 1
MQEDGECFKATVIYSPFFYIKVRDGKESEVEDYLRRKFENTIEHISREEKEDLDMVLIFRDNIFIGKSLGER